MTSFKTELVFKVAVADEHEGAELVTTLDPLNPSMPIDKTMPTLFGYTYHPTNNRELEPNCPNVELRYGSSNTVTNTDVLRLLRLIGSISHTTNMVCYYRCGDILGKFMIDNDYKEATACEYAFNTRINMTPDELPQQSPVSLYEYEQNWDWLTEVHTHYTFTKLYKLADIPELDYTSDRDEVLL